MNGYLQSVHETIITYMHLLFLQILVKYNGQERSRILTEDCEKKKKNIVKCILNRSGASALVKNLKNTYFKHEIVKTVMKDVMEEGGRTCEEQK